MKTPLLSSRQVITLCHHLHGDVLMALMIDAETLKPCLLSLEIAGDGVRTAFDAMLGDDEDLHDKAQILSTMALESYNNALVELAKRTKALVEQAEADQLNDCE